MGISIVPVSSTLLRHIADPAARSLALAGSAGLVLAVLRVKAIALQTAVWRGVLVAALAMPLIGMWGPSIRIAIPLPQFETQKTMAAAPVRSTPVPETQDITVASDNSVRVNATEMNVTPSEEAFPAPARGSGPLPWSLILACAYLIVACLLLARVFAGAALANRLARASTPIGDTIALRHLAMCARQVGLRLQPLLAESESIIVPVTVRVRRPAILLPASWRAWDDQKLAAVLAHEVSHVQRRDTLVQNVALIHRALFWFSPLGWWLERHLSDLAEQASDDAALSCGVEQTRYAEALLGFFASVQGSRSRVWWQGVAMAKCGRAEKRIDRILAWRNAMPKELRKSLVLTIAVLALPLAAVTASLHPSFDGFQVQEQAALPAPQAPPAPVQPAPSAHPVVQPGPTPAAPAAGPAVAPVAPATPAAGAVLAGPAAHPPMPAAPQVAPTPPTGPSGQAVSPRPSTPGADDLAPLREQVEAAKKSVFAAQQQVARAHDAIAKATASGPASQAYVQALDAARDAYQKAMSGYEAVMQEYRAALEEEQAAGVNGGVAGGVSGGTYGGIYNGVYGDSGPRFVIVRKNSGSVIMSGSSEDEAHAKALHSRIPGDFIWFERDEKSYIIRDQATIDRALKLWEPQQELGRQQEALGKQQEALGEQQEALGRKMEEVRVKIPDLSAQMEKLEARMKELSANGGTVEQIGDLQSEIGELQSRIGEIQSEAGSRQGEVGREQGELGRKQGELGRQQGELGRRQGELARQASRQMKELLDDAIAKRLAQPE